MNSTERKKRRTKEKRCRDYVGVACVDGTCPAALREEYEERCIPTVKNCRDCFYYKGCEDCALKDTEYCEGGGTESEY